MQESKEEMQMNKAQKHFSKIAHKCKKAKEGFKSCMRKKL